MANKNETTQETQTEITNERKKGAGTKERTNARQK